MSAASTECLSLLEGLLEYDPDARLSARQALKHPHFRELRDADKRAAKLARAQDAPVEADATANVTEPSVSAEGRFIWRLPLGCVCSHARCCWQIIWLRCSKASSLLVASILGNPKPRLLVCLSWQPFSIFSALTEDGVDPVQQRSLKQTLTRRFVSTRRTVNGAPGGMAVINGPQQPVRRLSLTEVDIPFCSCWIYSALQQRNTSKRRVYNRKAATISSGTKLPPLAVAGAKPSGLNATSVSSEW